MPKKFQVCIRNRDADRDGGGWRGCQRQVLDFTGWDKSKQLILPKVVELAVDFTGRDRISARFYLNR